MAVYFTPPASVPHGSSFTVSAGKGVAPVTTTATHAVLTSLGPNTMVDVTVRVGRSGPASDPVAVRTGGRHTRFVEMYRISEHQDPQDQEVDFLSNHDTGSAAGDVAFVTGSGTHFTPDFNTSVITQYCVEMDDVPYADYVSCNAPTSPHIGGEPNMTYTCVCNNWIDRVIGHQNTTKACGPVHPHPTLQEVKSPVTAGRGMPTCNCTDASLAGSRRHVGRMAVFLPWVCGMASNGLCPINVPFGYWYSTPVESQCKEGAPLGAATDSDLPCTWRRLQTARVLRGAALLLDGWNETHARGKGNKDIPQFQHNLAVWKNAFQRITPRPCGS